MFHLTSHIPHPRNMASPKEKIVVRNVTGPEHFHGQANVSANFEANPNTDIAQIPKYSIMWRKEKRKKKGDRQMVLYILFFAWLFLSGGLKRLTILVVSSSHSYNLMFCRTFKKNLIYSLSTFEPSLCTKGTTNVLLNFLFEFTKKISGRCRICRFLSNLWLKSSKNRKKNNPFFCIVLKSKFK
jgi:hypothetical protein